MCKKLKLFFAICVLGFFSRCGLIGIETLVNPKNKRRVVFFYDIHNKNNKAHSRLVLKELKKLGGSVTFSILMEGCLEAFDCSKPQESLGPDNFSREFFSEYNDAMINDLEETLLNHYCNALKIVLSFPADSPERKELALFMKDIGDSVACLKLAFSKTSLFFDLHTGVLCSLPELYWFKMICDFAQRYTTTIVYLGASHCDNLRESFLRCGYVKDKSLCYYAKKDCILLGSRQVKDFFVAINS